MILGGVIDHFLIDLILKCYINDSKNKNGVLLKYVVTRE